MTATSSAKIVARPLEVYVPRLVVNWLRDRPDDDYVAINGTMTFVDISGFTKLTERLARKGRVGAEEMSDILDATFGALLTVARSDGAELVKWGGDAVLLFYDGPDHAARAARSAVRMRRALRELNRALTSPGAVTLRMSVGIHSGEFHFFLVGDPAIHRELVVSGPSASVTAEMESVAEAGQIVVSDATAALLAPRLLGSPVAGGRLLRGEPPLADLPAVPRGISGIDVGQVLPPLIRRHLMASSGESEHRPIAVAFVQFSGTDALLRERGPAALAAALDECVRNVQHATSPLDVTFFESDINRDGGKIMLTAGAPRSSGDDEERMLRAARRIVDGAGTLPLRVGVNRGYVFAGDFGPDFRRTYSVKGDAINLAARVMGKAAAGQVLATRATITRSRTLFRNEALEPFLVKGKSEPVLAVSVGEVIGEQAGDGTESPLYGRAAELAVMREAIDRVRGGAATFVDVVGEPGIGKSRFVREVLALADGLVVVAAPSGAYESATAYFPVRGMLRAALGVETDTPDAAVRERLIDRVKENAPDLLLWLPLIAIPLGIEMSATSETSDLDEEFRKAKLEEVTIELLRMLLPTASVLVLDNAQFMDDESAQLLQRLESESDARPWLVLVVRREQGSGFVPVGTQPHYRRLELGPLDEAAAIELLLAATQRAPLTRQAIAAVAGRAGGNPLFLNALALVAGQTGELADLPESVEDVVTSQIDRLEPQDRTLLRYAAVLGMRFDASTLREMLRDWVDVLDGTALRRLDGFLRAERDGSVEFRHGVIRDVAYAGLPYRLRHEMHDRVGSALESALADPDVEAELLSMHFFHAGRYDKAWQYSRSAGGRAHSRYAYVAAAEFLARAIESARRAADVGPAQIADVEEELGDVRALLGRSHDAIASYRNARALLRQDAVAAGGLIFKEAVIEQRLGRVSRSLSL
ncbi:MAG: hypothetical protein QOG80_1463, partial [Pseudonocardiales bacterium]|nr:hypothetical protein [Pseudonocardiales bacterium]